ncbi:glycosyltransferase [Prevotella sp.]|uniref:glycosyltransferase n=1 Tax=Prevotella sp. TaxID=59823 RepID=UPI003077BE28
MKILQVITSLSTGGAEKLISEITPMLRDKGHQVDVLAFDGADTAFKEALIDKGIKVYSFGRNCNIYNPLFIFRLAKLMKNYDIVHTHNTAPQLFAAVGSVLCSVVLCTTEHTTSNRRRDWKWYAWIDKWMYSRYDKIICISNQAEDNLRKYLPKVKNVCTIFNGVDINRFHNAKPLDTLKSNKKVVAMVAGFRYQKDQDTLIKAFTHLDKDKYELWLVGDGERRSILEGLVNELGLTDNVKLLGIRNDIPNVLQTADIIVMSSHFEGLSLSNIEGMSVNKPFIASNVDGLREVVDGYGVLFPHEDYKALASIIKKLSADTDYYQQVAAKCWERAQMFDIQKMVDAYNEVYESLVKQKDNS